MATETKAKSATEAAKEAKTIADVVGKLTAALSPITQEVTDIENDIREMEGKLEEAKARRAMAEEKILEILGIKKPEATARKASKASGGSGSSDNAWKGKTPAEVKAYIAEHADDDKDKPGVATRKLTGVFGKPSDGWEAFHSEHKTAKSNGVTGAGGRWLAMK